MFDETEWCLEKDPIVMKARGRLCRALQYAVIALLDLEEAIRDQLLESSSFGLAEYEGVEDSTEGLFSLLGRGCDDGLDEQLAPLTRAYRRGVNKEERRASRALKAVGSARVKLFVARRQALHADTQRCRPSGPASTACSNVA